MVCALVLPGWASLEAAGHSPREARAGKCRSGLVRAVHAEGLIDSLCTDTVTVALRNLSTTLRHRRAIVLREGGATIAPEIAQAILDGRTDPRGTHPGRQRPDLDSGRIRVHHGAERASGPGEPAAGSDWGYDRGFLGGRHQRRRHRVAGGGAALARDCRGRERDRAHAGSRRPGRAARGSDAGAPARHTAPHPGDRRERRAALRAPVARRQRRSTRASDRRALGRSADRTFPMARTAARTPASLRDRSTAQGRSHPAHAQPSVAAGHSQRWSLSTHAARRGHRAHSRREGRHRRTSRDLPGVSRSRPPIGLRTGGCTGEPRPR